LADVCRAAAAAVGDQAARASHLTGPGIYLGDLVRLAIFYWAIVADALLMKVCVLACRCARACACRRGSAGAADSGSGKCWAAQRRMQVGRVRL
jgi:hypothetical protein